MRYSFDEWFVVTLARTIRDREAVFHGFGSPCAQVAMHVARRSHAPRMLLIEGATYAVNPEPSFIPPTGNDRALMRGAAYTMRFEEFFDFAMRGGVDRMFVSGVQIDPYGNTNVTAVGPLDRPKVKVGGGGGGCNMAGRIGSLTLWTTKHRSGRILVRECDFITDMGHRDGHHPHRANDRRGGGPQFIVTELGVFEFDVGGRARLSAIFPDVSLTEVEQATSFDLHVPDRVEVVSPPTAAELDLVRSIDPLGVRRSEFLARDLSRSFP